MRAFDLELAHALGQLTEADLAMLPLNVQPDARRRVHLAHIETGEGAQAGHGVAVVSVPKKYERLAWAMCCALNYAAEKSMPRKAT